MVFICAFGARAATFAPARCNGPQAEADQCRTRCERNCVPEAQCESRTGEPNEEPDCKCGYGVTEAGGSRSTRSLRTRPALLPGEQGYRHPVIGHERMQNAHGCDGADQKQRLVREHCDAI